MKRRNEKWKREKKKIEKEILVILPKKFIGTKPNHYSHAPPFEEATSRGITLHFVR